MYYYHVDVSLTPSEYAPERPAMVLAVSVEVTNHHPLVLVASVAGIAVTATIPLLLFILLTGSF